MSERAARLATAALALAGAGVAGYLTWIHYAGGSLVCLGGGGCETVQRSSYAELAGVPLALLGLVAYAVLLASALVRGLWSAAASAAVALGGVAFAGWLVYVQGAILHAWCHWCLTSDVLLALLAAVSVARVLVSGTAPQPRG